MSELHECKYCGIMTDAPDEQCYKAPQNTADDPNVMRWVAISEKLPEIDQWCFFWYYGKPIIGNYKGNGGFLCSEAGEFWRIDDEQINYWMPLPKPPVT